MKFIGQFIQHFISRFKNDVYLEDISTGTIASGGNLGLDSNNKIVKASEATGDITGVSITTDSGSGSKAEDTAGSADFSILGSSGVGVTNSGTTITAAVSAAQTTITSLLATDIKIGEDDQTKIDFETADTINFYAGNEKQLILTDGALTPGADNILDLGSSGVEFKDAYFDGTVTSDAFAGPLSGDVTGNVSGTAATVTGAAQTNITSLGTLTALTVDNVILMEQQSDIQTIQI